MPCISPVVRSVTFHTKSAFSRMENLFWGFCKLAEATSRIWSTQSIWQLSCHLTICIPERLSLDIGKGCFPVESTIRPDVPAVIYIEFASQNLEASCFRHLWNFCHEGSGLARYPLHFHCSERENFHTRSIFSNMENMFWVFCMLVEPIAVI